MSHIGFVSFLLLVCRPSEQPVWRQEVEKAWRQGWQCVQSARATHPASRSSHHVAPGKQHGVDTAVQSNAASEPTPNGSRAWCTLDSGM